MRIAKSITDLVGHTPLLELSHIVHQQALEAVLLAKVEACNPAGSVKDRVALSMIADAEQRGLLKAGGTIVEPTSGNTGIGLAAIGAAKGYRVILTMPETMSAERRQILAAYGARVVLTDGKAGMSGAIKKAQELAAELPDAWVPGQFENPANPAAHIAATGPEIWEDTDGKVDTFVAGVGTGGTITGVGTYLKGKNPKIQIIAVEPASSAVLSGNPAGPHKIQGIGAGFIPEVLKTGIYDELIQVSDEEAFRGGRMLAQKEGLLSGISSGAAVWAAVQYAKRAENKGKCVVVLLPDTGERYLSTTMFGGENDGWNG